ncbi:transcriptional regulator, AraC family [Flavobacteriaceae bacterium MAR_2010_188]|nr:transcriptional regulator, AraC family [Flavobacteriaceae bacterium MAR_2010_188]
MKTFIVQSLPLKEVIQSLAKEMSTGFTERCDQFFLDIPSEFGSGSIMGIDFDSGMGIIQYDCTFNDDVEIQFIVNKVHPLKFLFCLEGDLIHRFEDDETNHSIKQYQNAIVASSRFNGHILRFKKNTAIKLNSLELSRKEFQAKAICELKSLENPIQELFKDVDADNTFYYEGYYSLELSDVFAGILKFDHQDFLRKMFLEGKSYLILTRQLVQFQDDLKDFPNRSVLRKFEVKQVKAAAKKIEEQLETLTSIKELAKEFGLNSNKLQTGFQLLFGTSVNQYIQRQRLLHARKLLETTDLNMSQISDAVGLNSRSYFSKIFKEEFGISPSDLKRKNFEQFQSNRNQDI